jgi:uroporphyrinogen III methyltransferase/synthase
MGGGRIAEIAERLLLAGKAADTPASVIENGTTSRQRCVCAELARLAARAEEERIAAPSVIVIGSVVSLRRETDNHAPLPLGGFRVWLTQARKNACHSPRLGFMLREAGAEVISTPCLEIKPLDVDMRAQRLDTFDWMLFSSSAGVENFFLQLRRSRMDIREIGSARIAAVGPATLAAAEGRGLRVDYIPEIHDGESMARGIAELGAKRALMIRPMGAAPAWSDILRSRGVDLRELCLYRTESSPSPFINLCEEGDIVVFSSSSSVSVFTNAISEDVKTSGIRAVCIGKPTSVTASNAGYDVSIAREATDAALFNTILASSGRKI